MNVSSNISDQTRYPSISEYARSLEMGCGVFRSLRIDDIARDITGAPSVVCGNNAAVFTVMTDGRKRQLKCFFRPGGPRREVYDHLAEYRSALVPRVEYLPAEMYVYDRDGQGAYYDVVVADRIEGVTLSRRVRNAAFGGDGAVLASLAAELTGAMSVLLSEPWAHGDLKPENIIVTPEGKIRLIDYDAAWVPALSGMEAGELGTPEWQHPARDARFYDKHIDDYSIALLCVTLHAIALDPSLYLATAPHDCSLLSPAGISDGSDPVHGMIERLFADRGFDAGVRLCSLLRSPSPVFECLRELVKK